MENNMNLFPEEKKAILLKQYKRVKACGKTHSSPYIVCETIEFV